MNQRLPGETCTGAGESRPPISRRGPSRPRGGVGRLTLPLAVLLWLLTLLPGCASVQAQPAILPEGSGLAGRYPGDSGIDRDPAVVFVEDFEAPALEEVRRRWDDMKNAGIMSLSGDIPAGSSGSRSLLMTHTGGKDTGGHLYRRLAPGYEKLHFRFYVKFDRDAAPNHHFFHVGGYRPLTSHPQGGAGNRPRGDERFSVGVEPFGSAWTWDYYTYWMEMRGSPPRGATWGNAFIRNPDLKVRRGEWSCLELMVRMNEPAKRDGEMALWIDGRRVSHLGPGFPRGHWIYDKFEPGKGGRGVRWSDERGGPVEIETPAGGAPFEGFRWRSDARLDLNFLWLLNYITRAPEGHVSKVWFDQVVVAREYIGPIVPRKGSPIRPPAGRLAIRKRRTEPRAGRLRVIPADRSHPAVRSRTSGILGQVASFQSLQTSGELNTGVATCFK